MAFNNSDCSGKPVVAGVIDSGILGYPPANPIELTNPINHHHNITFARALSTSAHHLRYAESDSSSVSADELHEIHFTGEFLGNNFL